MPLPTTQSQCSVDFRDSFLFCSWFTLESFKILRIKCISHTHTSRICKLNRVPTGTVFLLLQLSILWYYESLTPNEVAIPGALLQQNALGSF